MSEIKRTNEVESYKTTVSWLDDFFNKMANNTPPAPPSVFAAKEKFATIEDKMEDIKSRVGFANIERITKESSSDITAHSSKTCDCEKSGKKCKCGIKDNSQKLEQIKVILNYISKMLDELPHLVEAEVIAKCRDDKDLKFDDAKIKPSKLSQFIKKKKGKKQEPIEIVYVSPDITMGNDPTENMADYYRHSMPNIF